MMMMTTMIQMIHRWIRIEAIVAVDVDVDVVTEMLVTVVLL